MMRPVLSRPEYLALRNSGNQVQNVAAVRDGDESLKGKLLQMNYSCLPNEDGSLKGSTKAANSVGMDIDHIKKEEMEAVKERILAKREELGLLMLELSARGEGYHLVFKRRPEMSQEENLRWASKLLGVEFDKGAKDITRVFFTTTADENDLIWLNDDIFRPTPPCGHPSRNGGEAGAMEDPSKSPREGRLAGAETSNPEQCAANERSEALPLTGERGEGLSFKGIPYATIIAEYWRRTGGEPVEGERNVKLYQLAVNLRAICDNKKAVLMAVMPRFGLNETEMQNIVDSACKESPKGISKMMASIVNNLSEGTSSNESLLRGDAEGSLGGVSLPPMPKRLPPLIKLLVSKTPAIYQPAVAHAVFPSLGVHLHRVQFRYIDNVLHEATLMNVLMAGTGAGKDCISMPINRIMADIRVRDEENLERERQWKREVTSKGANKDKRQRPEGLVIQEIDADMTNPAFVMRMAEADGHFLYTKMNEIEQFDALRGAGRGGQQFQIMCLSFDPGNRYGQTRVGVQSVTEKVTVRFNWNATTTILKGQRYFRSVLTDGPISRINFCTIPEREIGAEMPVYGTYDAAFDEQLRPYIENLTKARGVVDCPQATRLAKRLVAETAEQAVLTSDRVYENLSFRANVIAYLKACVLYVAQGCKWSKDIEDFVRWSLEYDLACKMQFFGDAIRQAEEAISAGPQRKCRNLLELLPETFTMDDAIALRRRLGMTVEGTQAMVRTWRNRGYIDLCRAATQDCELRTNEQANSYRKLKYI